VLILFVFTRIFFKGEVFIVTRFVLFNIFSILPSRKRHGGLPGVFWRRIGLTTIRLHTAYRMLA